MVAFLNRVERIFARVFQRQDDVVDASKLIVHGEHEVIYETVSYRISIVACGCVAVKLLCWTLALSFAAFGRPTRISCVTLGLS